MVFVSPQWRFFKATQALGYFQGRIMKSLEAADCLSEADIAKLEDIVRQLHLQLRSMMIDANKRDSLHEVEQYRKIREGMEKEMPGLVP